jgi:hypothetical protein
MIEDIIVNPLLFDIGIFIFINSIIWQQMFSSRGLENVFK